MKRPCVWIYLLVFVAGSGAVRAAWAQSLEFSTYWGTGGANNRTVVIDRNGNIYMSGGTSHTDWPTTFGAVHAGGGESDVTIAKFAPNGKLIWSRLLGGPSEDYAYVSAVSPNGELYVSGRAGSGFPTTPNAFDRDGRIDIFLASWFEHLPNYLFRNVTDTGNWLTVRVDGRGKKLNSMGIGAVVRVYTAGRLGEPEHLLGRHDMAIGTGYASGDEAMAHFGLGKTEQCDVEVRWREHRMVQRDLATNQAITMHLE